MEERTILCYNFFERVRKRLSSEKYTFRNWPFSFWEKPVPKSPRRLSGSGGGGWRASFFLRFGGKGGGLESQEL